MAKINSRTCLSLLQNLEVGSPIAEDDDLLFESRVETSIFEDLVADKIDIIRGTKGSGKSALYRLIGSYLADNFLNDRRTVVIRGVDTKGDPIFQKFEDDFAKFTETDFENFWRVYFISLVTSQFIGNQRYAHLTRQAKGELRSFKRLAKEQHFPINSTKFSLLTLVAWVITKIPKVKRVEAGVNAESPTIGVEFDNDSSPGSTNHNTNVCCGVTRKTGCLTGAVRHQTLDLA
jgi:hypothetical protein